MKKRPTKSNSTMATKRGLRRPHLKMAILAILVLAASTLSGCVVTQSARSGVLEVRWEVAACASSGVSSVRIKVRRGGFLEEDSGPLVCTKGFQSFSVEPGTYAVELTAKDTSGALISSADAGNLVVDPGKTTTTPVLPLVATRRNTSGGSVTVGWTVLGQPANTGCAKADIKTVTISMLNPSKTQVVAHASVPCNVGQATVLNVPAGQTWVQLDGTTSQNLTFYGNLALFGPVTVQAGFDTKLTSTLDIGDLRSSVGVQWQFANNNTCAGNNVSHVLIEVADSNKKVIIPVTAKDAKKPCEIDLNTPYAQRVVDLLFSEPTCKIPQGAKGLVICGITGTSIGVRVSALDATTGQILFGGSMEVLDIPAGTHTDLQTRVSLAPCSAQNKCASP